jgi:hypothetical protein
LKTLFTTSSTINNHQLLKLFDQDEIVFGELFQNKFPSEKSISFAHELLSFCLDLNIQKVYATRAGELLPLSEAKVLFAEFGIDIELPDLNQIFSINNFLHEAHSFASLSSQLLSAGYPNQKLALGKADLKGDLLIIDDEVKDFKQVWSKLKSISFTQIGKLFNQPDFDLLNIYQLAEKLNEVNVLFKNGQTHFFDTVDPSLALVIDLMLKQNNCLGFYQIYYSGHQILRLKNIAY